MISRYSAGMRELERDRRKYPRPPAPRLSDLFDVQSRWWMPAGMALVSSRKSHVLITGITS